jgi:hypothetical protein
MFPPPQNPNDPTPDLPPGPGQPVTPRKPADPNNLVGPAGFGAAGFVGPNAVLPYRIDFENEPTATAPAQQVTVTEQLDPSLDPNTFALTEVGFGDTLISVPAARGQHFQTTGPLTLNGKTFQVEIEAGLNPQTGEVFATFQSIDPATSLPPDALTGFLPPEDGTGRGMGHISYLIQPRAGLATGTPTGSVQFQIDGSTFGSPVTLNNGTASIMTAALSAGTHSVLAFYSSATSNFGNSDNSAAPFTQAVSPATLTITADNQTKVYGAPLPALTASYSGFVNGDSPGSLTTLPTLSTTATAASHVVAGGYSITVSGAADPNSTISYVSGTLTITRANQTIRWSNPANILVGTALGSKQLNATVAVIGPAPAGALTYNPAAGTVLGAGSSQVLTVTTAATQDYNAATASALINVLYSFSGFMGPLQRTQTFRIGQLVSIQFQLLDAAGNLITDPNAISSLQVAPVNPGGSLSTPFGPTLYNFPHMGFERDHFTGSWVTRGLTAGLYEILVGLADGTIQTVLVQLIGGSKSAKGPNR